MAQRRVDSSSCRTMYIRAHHYKVDDFHQEFDCRVVLIPYELVLKSMYPLLQQWHRKLNIEYLYLSSKGLALLVEPCLIVFHHTALQEPTLDWTYTLGILSVLLPIQSPELQFPLVQFIMMIRTQRYLLSIYGNLERIHSRNPSFWSLLLSSQKHPGASCAHGAFPPYPRSAPSQSTAMHGSA